MSLKPVFPQSIHQHLDQGAALVDIRSADEYAREHIVQAAWKKAGLHGE